MQWQKPLKSGSSICSRNSLQMHLFSSVRSSRQGQYPPVRFRPSRIMATISLSSLSRTAMSSRPFLPIIVPFQKLSRKISSERLKNIFEFAFYFAKKIYQYHLLGRNKEHIIDNWFHKVL